MDLNQILETVGRMFPSANLRGAVDRAQEAIKGTPDTLEGVQRTAQRLGIDARVVDSIYTRYGRTAQARALCGLLGTSPEALKADADKIVGGAQNRSQPPQNAKAGHSQKFPRLK